MKRPSIVSRTQLALELESEDPFKPNQELIEQITAALADLLLEAIGARSVAAEREEGGGDESEGHS